MNPHSGGLLEGRGHCVKNLNEVFHQKTAQGNFLKSFKNSVQLFNFFQGSFLASISDIECNSL